MVSPVGSSDHSSLSLTLQVEQPVLNFSIEKEIYLKRGVNWRAVAEDVEAMPWREVFCHAGPVERMNELLLGILQCHVRTKTIKIRSKDKPWFDAECRVAYDEKQAACRRWQRSRVRENYISYVEARDQAEDIYAAAVNRYDQDVRQRLLDTKNPHRREGGRP